MAWIVDRTLRVQVDGNLVLVVPGKPLPMTDEFTDEKLLMMKSRKWIHWEDDTDEKTVPGIKKTKIAKKKKISQKLLDFDE